MAATWLNGGMDYKANLFMKRTAEQDLTVRLYTNNITPAVTDTAASYTECALAGYANVTLTPANWAGGTAGGISSYAYPTLTFTFSAYAGGTTIYGYFVTIPGVIGVLAELFSVPYVVPPGGGSLTVDVTYTDRKL